MLYVRDVLLAGTNFCEMRLSEEQLAVFRDAMAVTGEHELTDGLTAVLKVGLKRWAD